MKHVILNFIILSVVCISCSKKDTACNLNDSNVTASASETANVQSYLTANSIAATLHPSGFFYKITQAGTGEVIANLCSLVSVKYTGRLTNGMVFDPSTAGSTSTNGTFTLGQVILGWQKGLPLISSGGKISLYIPPSLGYGSVAVGSIPANSILIFDIELISVANIH